MRGGASYPNAYLGHMASETVVSHNVMTSGQLPKHMGWSDEWYRDVAGLLGTAGGRYVTGSMSSTQFDTLINAGGYPKLADYLHATFPGTIVAAIGEKNYAVHTMGGPHADMRITFGSRTADCDGVPTTDGPDLARAGRRRCAVVHRRTRVQPLLRRRRQGPRLRHPRRLAGLDVPARGQPRHGRRRRRHPRRVRHEGGDVWVTDAAFEVMDNEDWSGLLLTYGGIDKAGHMWGGLNDRPPYPGGDAHTHMAAAAKAADEQVGRVVQKLKDDGPARRDADRADHRPRAADQQALLRRRRVRHARSGQPQLVLRRRRRRDLPRPVTGDPAAGRRDRQRRDEHAGLRDPHLAGRPVA